MNDFHFAVVIGINMYPRISPLTAAHADAEDFYRWVTSPSGGGVHPADNPEKLKRNAKLILATLPQGATEDQIQPTREAIYSALDEFKVRVKGIRPAAWPQTRLYFFAAGHGIAPDPRDSALLGANADRNHLARHVSCVSLLEFFNRVQLFRELVIFADCCRTPYKNVMRVPTEWTDDDLNNGGVRRFLACGAVFYRQSFEELALPPDDRRGYFSRALMDGLRGAPTATDKVIGRVTSTRLKTHIEEHMRRATDPKTNKGFREPLTPDFMDEGPGEILFAAPIAAVEHPVRLEVRSIVVTGLEVVSDLRAPRVPTRPSARDPSVFECMLPVGNYEAVPIGLPPWPPGQEWLFKVVEGGVTRAF